MVKPVPYKIVVYDLKLKHYFDTCQIRYLFTKYFKLVSLLK